MLITLLVLGTGSVPLSAAIPSGGGIDGCCAPAMVDVPSVSAFHEASEVAGSGCCGSDVTEVAEDDADEPRGGCGEDGHECSDDCACPGCPCHHAGPVPVARVSAPMSVGTIAVAVAGVPEVRWRPRDAAMDLLRPPRA